MTPPVSPKSTAPATLIFICPRPLEVGMRLSSADGQWVCVEALEDEGEYETVYNLRVSDYQTYFVGEPDWGFSVWAHNTYQDVLSRLLNDGHIDQTRYKSALGDDFGRWGYDQLSKELDDDAIVSLLSMHSPNVPSMPKNLGLPSDALLVSQRTVRMGVDD